MASTDTSGLAIKLDALRAAAEPTTSGGSDDIGEVSWVVPTITLRYPSNIPGLPGHNWANAISMATPIAHKGVIAGAKVLARTALEFFVTPEARAGRVALLPRGADQGHPVHAVHRRGRPAGDLAQHGR